MELDDSNPKKLDQFKTNFHTDHRKLEETWELKMEDEGYHKANLVNNIVEYIPGLPFTYLTQDKAYTPIPTSDPITATTIQPSPVANVDTYSASNILPQLLNRMQQIQELLIQIDKKQTVWGVKNSNRNNRRTPTLQAATEPR